MIDTNSTDNVSLAWWIFKRHNTTAAKEPGIATLCGALTP